MKTSRCYFKKLIAAFLMASFIVTMLVPLTADAALPKPSSYSFELWRGNDGSFNSCWVSWRYDDWYMEEGVIDGFEVVTTWSDGSNGKYDYYDRYDGSLDWASDNNDRYSVYIEGLNKKHIYFSRVRAYYYDYYGYIHYCPWSNYVFITPWPTSVTKSLPNAKKAEVKIKWNTIYGSNGYNVFITTNPASGNWYWNQSTATRATATTALIKKYRGSKLKKKTNYYVRIITRRMRNGVFCTVPAPSSSYYQVKFYLTQK